MKRTLPITLCKISLCHNDKVKSPPGALRGGEQGSALTPEPPAQPVPVTEEEAPGTVTWPEAAAAE